MARPGLFVYGTLVEGERRSSMLGDPPRRPAKVFGRLYHLPAGYPAVSLGGEEPVYGELLPPVPEPLLRLLDHYEGVADGLYRRVQVRAITGLEQHLAWIYVMDDPMARGGRRIPSGRWRSFDHSR
ncbi:MAG: gamma-glutamylcyclotransferase [Deltaproteobacteria bacterium]|nr:MAG: gamma-glutamylcyclotransferase [Deltaproteobacteria bacterium]